MSTRRLEGRSAIVTGAARGIGRAIVSKLVSEGARVLANDLDSEALTALQAEVVRAGGICEMLAGDVTEPDFGDRAVGTCIERLGDLDILVNNAGYVWKFEDRESHGRTVVRDDRRPCGQHSSACYARLVIIFDRWRRKGAPRTRKVVNVSSISGLFGEATQFSYSAAKSALVGMTRSLAKDWGRYNVTVNCVAFGYIETRLTQVYEGEAPQIEVGDRTIKVGLDVAQLEMMKRLIPLGRAGTPDEAAGAVYLFCMPESDFISGEVIVAGGGLRVWGRPMTASGAAMGSYLG
jgi:3-oxoacyl-[acyl-carrier protein] reductase